MTAGAWFRDRFRSFVALAVASLLAVTVPTALFVADRSGTESPGASDVRNFLSMLNARSPGERSTGELSQTKNQIFAERGPTQRALGKINQPRNGPNEFVRAVTQPEGLPFIDVVPSAELGKAIAPVLAVNSTPLSGGLIVPTSIGSGGVIGSGGGGGGGDTPGGTTPVIAPNDLPTIAAVPEPATWLTMLIGFTGIGVIFRRRRGRTLLFM